MSFLYKQSIDGYPFVYSEDAIHTDLVFTHGDFNLAAMALDIRRVLGEQYVSQFYEGYRIKGRFDAGKMAQYISIVEA